MLLFSKNCLVGKTTIRANICGFAKGVQMTTTTNVLVTGGTGFVGSWMKKTKPDDCNFWGMSKDDYNKVAFESSTGVNSVVHLAPIAPTNAIQCARLNNARLLYCSSGIVYHPENDTEYRQNKIRWEQECLESGVDVVIARPFTFMGSSKVWNALFKAAREGKPLEVYWIPTTRSFMHGAEMGRWMWAILLRGRSGQAYDVGSSKPVPIWTLAERIKALCKTDSEIRYLHKVVPMPVYLPENTDRTKNLL